MVRDNIDFTVADATSGQDLTRVALIQIILDIESEDHQMLPIKVLRQLIQFYGDRVEPILSHYLERPMNAFLHHHTDAEETREASLDSIRGQGPDIVANQHKASGTESEGIRAALDMLRRKIDRLDRSDQSKLDS